MLGPSWGAPRCAEIQGMGQSGNGTRGCSGGTEQRWARFAPGEKSIQGHVRGFILPSPAPQQGGKALQGSQPGGGCDKPKDPPKTTSLTTHGMGGRPPRSPALPPERNVLPSAPSTSAPAEGTRGRLFTRPGTGWMGHLPWGHLWGFLCCPCCSHRHNFSLHVSLDLFIYPYLYLYI